jgi:sugar phosphate isomerase/epimerase
MRLSVFTASLPELSPDEAVAMAADVGLDGLEWRVVDQQPSSDGRPGFWAGNRCTLPLATFEHDAPRVRTMTEAAGLAVSAVGGYATCLELADVERVMRGAALLGATRARVRAPNYDGSVAYWPLRDRARSAYREVVAIGAAHGVKPLIELHHGTILPSASAARSFLDGFDPATIGVIHDAGNMALEGHEHYRMALEVLGPYLAHVHLKNVRWRRSDGGWEPEWVPLGEGLVNVSALVDALHAVGYDGWIAFEDFSTGRGPRERTADNVARVRALLG